jgi:hypothetical protein
MTRAERIEEYKQLIEDEIELLRTAQENEQDANEWLKLDNAIDALLIHKDNASAEIDAALAEPVVTLDYTLPAPKVIKMMDDPRTERQAQILYALNDEPVTKEMVLSLIDELAEIETDTQKNPPEFGGKEWFDNVEEVKF